MSKLRPIAIYLPQYHPIPENDIWWGKGFTEWTKVTMAKPLFKGHYQPHFPSDLGYYDLRVSDTRQEQANLAKQYGIFGFCYYHYWFNGKRLLERPFREVMESGKPDFPFMLCWANENWTRTWDGGDSVILQKQEYSQQDALNHIRYLLPIFNDPRYIKVDNKPVFCIYKSSIITDIDNYIKIFRNEARKYNLELHICRFESFGKYGKQYLSQNFDAAVEFQPFTQTMPGFQHDIVTPGYVKNIPQRLLNKLLQKLNFKNLYNERMFAIEARLDYNEYINYIIHNYDYPTDYVRYPCVVPSWDNTARKGSKSFLFKNANPEKYKQWLKYHVTNFIPATDENNFVFINAWNEWAEGNHLEPCQKWGRQYLEATQTALSD